MYLKKVEEFHSAFDAPVLEKPTLIDKERAKLRIRLLQEELDELTEAIENNDLVEVADALCDLQYVLSGAVLEFGMGNSFDEMFNEVHRSNMSKMCKDMSEAKDTEDYYAERDNAEVYFKQKPNGIIVCRLTDHKVLKSVNYSPANLEKWI